MRLRITVQRLMLLTETEVQLLMTIIIVIITTTIIIIKLNIDKKEISKEQSAALLGSAKILNIVLDLHG